MKAAVFAGPRRPLHIERVADPQPNAGELVLRVTACGICGSDLHMADVDDAAGGVPPLPLGAVMGHEFAGEVVDAAADVRAAWRDGARVTALPTLGCGKCAACLSGQGTRCAARASLGLGREPGAYAEFVRVSALETIPLPANVDDDTAATVEPLAVGLRAVNVAKLERGDDVLVMGSGPIGLAVSAWCRFFGARHIVATDLSAARLERAARMGASATIDAGSQDVVAGAKAIAGARPRVIFDCVGAPGSLQLAMDYAPSEGRVVVAGVCMQPDRVLPAKAITKELQLNFVYAYRRQDFAFTVDMLAAGRIDPRPMRSGKVGFDTFSATFENLKSAKDECKVLLDPRS